MRLFPFSHFKISLEVWRHKVSWEVFVGVRGNWHWDGCQSLMISVGIFGIYMALGIMIKAAEHHCDSIHSLQWHARVFFGVRPSNIHLYSLFILISLLRLPWCQEFWSSHARSCSSSSGNDAINWSDLTIPKDIFSCSKGEEQYSRGQGENGREFRIYRFSEHAEDWKLHKLIWCYSLLRLNYSSNHEGGSPPPPTSPYLSWCISIVEWKKHGSLRKEEVRETESTNYHSSWVRGRRKHWYSQQPLRLDLVRYLAAANCSSDTLTSPPHTVSKRATVLIGLNCVRDGRGN